MQVAWTQWSDCGSPAATAGNVGRYRPTFSHKSQVFSLPTLDPTAASELRIQYDANIYFVEPLRRPTPVVRKIRPSTVSSGVGGLPL